LEHIIRSGPLHLAGHLARPATPTSTPPCGLVLCHGFPAAPGATASSGQTYRELADRIAADTGWAVLTFDFRGAGASEGDFSLGGWLDDLRAATDHLLATEEVSGVWLAGSSAGGGLAICHTAEDERVRGVATLAAPATFLSWAADPAGFLERAREVGVVTGADHPDDFDYWSRELSEILPVAVIGKIPPRPVLLIHGSDDETIPLDDGRELAEAAGGDVELVVVNRAGHRLRHDPRAVAVLMGWLDRQAAA
jgi:putative redox protein